MRNYNLFINTVTAMLHLQTEFFFHTYQTAETRWDSHHRRTSQPGRVVLA